MRIACRNCLHPLRGSRFGESVTELGFDPTLLPPMAAKVVADVFPHVETFFWDDTNHDEEDEDASIMRVAMSLCEIATAWPRLSSIKVGNVTSSVHDPPTYHQMKTALLPVMMAAQMSQRPLKLTHASIVPEQWEHAMGEWMRLREEWQHLLSTSGTRSWVDMDPA